MIGFKVGNQQLIDVVVPMGAEHSDVWRRAFMVGLASCNYTIARAFADAYGLSCPLVANNSQRGRCAQVLQFLINDEPDELNAYLTAWRTAGTVEDMRQVVAGEGEGGPTDGAVRVAVARFLGAGVR